MTNEVKPDDFVVQHGPAALVAMLDKPAWTLYRHNRFIHSVPSTEDDLFDLFKSIIITPQIEADAVLNDLKLKGKFKLDSLRHIWADAFAEWEALRPADEPVYSAERSIEISDFIPRGIVLRDIRNALRDDGNFYLFGGDMILVDGAERRVIDPTLLPGTLADIGIETTKAKGKDVSYMLLPVDHAKAAVRSREVRKYLNEVILFTDHPTYDKNWDLLKPGFCKNEGVYYAGREISPLGSKRTILEIVSGMLFKNQASKENYIATLLTGILRNRYRGDRPLVPLTANRPQVGKTLAAKVAAIIAEGMLPRSITYTPNDEEFEKQICSVIRMRDILLIDNVKSSKPIDSPVLERLITDDPMNFRLLGTNNSISRANTIIAMITMNGAQFSRDLISRSLPVEFFLDETVDASTYAFPNDRILEFVAANRLRAIQELCGMVETWKSAGCPLSDKPFRFRVWAQEIGGIMHANGFTAFLDNLEEAAAGFDHLAHEIGEMFGCALGQEVSARKLVEICQAADLLPEILISKKAPTAMTALVRKYVGKLLPLPDGAKFHLTERWHLSDKVYVFKAEPRTSIKPAGDVPCSTGTAGDIRKKGPRVSTDLDYGEVIRQPGNPGTFSRLGEKAENKGDRASAASSAITGAAFREGVSFVPGVPGQDDNDLNLKGKNAGDGASTRSPGDPGQGPTSPCTVPPTEDSEGNGLDW